MKAKVNAMVDAAGNGETAKVQEFLAAGVDVNAVDRRGWSALVWACRYGHGDIVRLLLDNDAKVNHVDKYGYSALVQACWNGHGDIVRLLLDNDANVNYVTPDGKSALVRACENGHGDIVRLLLDNDANVHHVDKVGYSALVQACWGGHGDIVRLLLDNDANVNYVTPYGDSALVKACEDGHGDIVRLLLDHGADVNHVDRNGNTPLHTACEYYNPSQQNQIDLCIILIENGADTSICNRRGLTPIDLLGQRGYGINTDKTKPIKRALERQEYSKLEAGSEPVTVKLFLLGDAAAGKTTIKRALLMENTPQNDTHDPTPGIDVGTYDIDGVGKLSIWDAAGQIEYHITHGMFLGNENAVVVVVYDLHKDQESKEKLQYWFKFLKCGKSAAAKSEMKNSSAAAKSKLKIIILASHLDEFTDVETATRVARGNLGAIKRDFDEAFEIDGSVLMVNARLCQSQGMQELRKVLKDNCQEIQGSRALPKLCEKILERKAEWVTSKSPILPYEEYKEKVREIHHLVTDDFIRISANYLRDMGEVFIAQSADSNQEHVVLNTQWLSFSIIGPTFAGFEFKDKLKRLKSQPFYTQAELEDYYGDIADFPTLALLLRSLELMVTIKEGEYIIPAKLTESSEKPPFKLKYGRCIACADKSMFAPILFPAVQGRILKDPRFKGNQPLVTLENLQFTMDVKGWVWQMLGNKDVINFAVEGVTGNEEGCYKSLNKIQEMIVLALNEFSPGTEVTTGYLSPFSLQNSALKSVAYYKLEEIEEGDNHQDDLVPKNSTVLKEVPTEQEKTTDILIAGADPHFIRKKGVQCKYHWMLQQKKLYSLMDKPNSLRTDYRSLAELLQVDEYDTSDGSHTKAIITHWCKTTGKNMTLGMLYTMLKHPGLIGNDQGAGIIEQMLKDNGQHTCSIQMGNICMMSGGFPDIVLLWRAILRKTHNDLKKQMKEPSAIMQSMVNSIDTFPAEYADEIKNTEKEGRVQAVDQLISNLITRKEPNWPDEFLKPMWNHNREVAKKVISARDELLMKPFFASVAAAATKKSKDEESNIPQDTSIQATNDDFDDVKKLLGPDDLQKLFDALPGISSEDVEKAKVAAGTPDPDLQATAVLRKWREINGSKATPTAILNALGKCTCKSGMAKQELTEKWSKEDTGIMATNQDFTDVTILLGPDDLRKLFDALGIKSQDIEKAEKGADTKDVDLKAKEVLRKWRQMKGSEATHRTVLDALNCTCKNVKAKQKLEEKWNKEDTDMSPLHGNSKDKQDLEEKRKKQDTDMSSASIRTRGSNKDKQDIEKRKKQGDDDSPGAAALPKGVSSISGDDDSPGAAALPKGVSSISEVSDTDFKSLIKQLSPGELHELYTKLGLSAASIAKAESSVKTRNIIQRAMPVLQTWREKKGSKATHKAILKGLEKCRFVNAKQKLEKLWKQ